MGVLKNLMDMVRASWMPGLAAVQTRLMGPYYKAVFLASIARSDLLGAFAGNRALGVDDVALRIGAGSRPDLVAPWLELGVSTGVLRRDPSGRFRLRSVEARLLARDASGIGPAGLLEVVLYHCEAILAAPRLASSGAVLRLGEQGPAIIARSTRLVEPLVKATVRQLVQQARPRTWLEVGAGDGEYALYAQKQEPNLQVTCLEIEEELVEQMRDKFLQRGVSGNVTVEHGDVRELKGRRFDVVTLHNLIYYFSRGERAELLRHCAELLESGGTLLLTTSVPGRVTAVSALDLWFRCSVVRSGLPHEEEIFCAFREAGFTQITRTKPLPGFSLVAFMACKEGMRG